MFEWTTGDDHDAFPPPASCTCACEGSISRPKSQFRRKLPSGKTVSIHPVSARWKKDIRSAFEDVKKTLYDQNREDSFKQAKVIRIQLQNLLWSLFPCRTAAAV
jgi:hypothetical protein